MAGLLRDAARPLVKEELDKIDVAFREVEDSAFEQLNSLSVELLVPLMLRDDLAGMLSLGGKQSREMYSQEELSLLSAL